MSGEAPPTKKTRLDDGSGAPTATSAEDSRYSSTNGTGFSMESDVNEMIGDLLKEELQLVLTRVLVNDPNQATPIKKQLVQVFKNRQRVTPPSQTDLTTYTNLTQTFRQLQQQIMFGAPATMGSPQQGGMAPSMMGASQLPFQMEDELNAGMGGGMMYGGMGMSSVGVGGAINLTVVRRKIKDAFLSNQRNLNKRGRYGEEVRASYTLDTMVIRQEKERGKDLCIGKNSGSNDVERVDNTRNGLSILEAVTSEYVNRGNELGEVNVSGYQEMLNEIANDWVEVFLHKDLPISQNERDEFAKKLFDWDTSASEDEGTFAIARASARLGWDNTHLQNVLRGEHIGKFVEPKSLTIARLNQLEREERYQDGVNLAKAVDLDFYAAKFLLKLQKTAEAEQSALKIEDPEKVFSIAQVARALDVNVAFNLIIHVLGMYAKATAEQNTLSWGQEMSDRTNWLVDLAISSKNVDQLVVKCEESVKHKFIQYQIAKILKEKEQYAAALRLGKDCLVPYPTTGHVSRIQPQPVHASFGGGNLAIPTPVVNNNADLPSWIPKDLATWVWNLAHEMVILDVAGDEPHDDLLNGVVEHILENVQDITQLVQLIQQMSYKKEFAQLLTVGAKAFERVSEQRSAELELQKLWINAFLTAKPELQHMYQNVSIPAVLPNEIEQQQQQAQASSVNPSPTTPQPVVLPYADIIKRPEFALLVKSGTVVQGNTLTPTINLNQQHNARWDQFVYQVANAMITAAFDSQVTIIASVTIGTQTFRPVKAMTNDELKNVLAQCLNQITNLDNLIQLPRSLHQRGAEFHFLSLRACDAAHARIDTVIEEKAKRDVVTTELAQLRHEQVELTNNPSASNTKKLQQIMTRILELDYVVRVNNLSPPNTNYNQNQYDNYHYQVSSLAMTIAFDAKSPVLVLDEAKRLPEEEVQQTFERNLTYVTGPNLLLQLIEVTGQRNEYEMAVRIAERAHGSIEEYARAKEERARLQVPLQILQAEQSDLATRKQQQLPAEKQKELRRLEKALTDLPQVKTHFDHDNVDQYENQHSQIATAVIRTAINSKVLAANQQSQSAFGQLQQSSQPVIVIVPMSDERIRQVVEQNLKFVKSPANLISLATLLNSEHELCLYVGDVCMNRLKELSREKEARRTPFLKYRRLLDEQEKLAVLKKPLPAEKQQELNNYVFESKLQAILIPRYAEQGYEQFDNLIKNINETILKALLRQKSQVVSELERIKAQEVLRVRDLDTMDEADEGESAEEARKKVLNEQLKELDKHIVGVIDRVLEFIHNPYHLQNIGQQLHNHGEYSLILRIGEHTQAVIEKLNIERQEREKVRQELAELEQEDEEIKEQRKQSKNKGKKMEDDKITLMEELKLKVTLMNESPGYQNSTAADLEECHFNIASMMINAAVEARDSEDRKHEQAIISAPTDEEQKERQKERDSSNIEHDKRIEAVVDRSIVYVRHPQYVLQLLENMKRRNNRVTINVNEEDENANNDLNLVLKLGRRVVDECLICEEKRHSRDVPEQKVAILLEEQKELEVLRKTLTDAQQKELETLQEKLEGKELALPDYLLASNKRGVVTYDQISNWRFSALSKMIQTVASMKQDLNEAIESSENEVSQTAHKKAAKLAQLLVDILNLVKSSLTNVNNLQSVVVDMQNRKEYDLCVDLGKHTHVVIDKLRKRLSDRVLPQQKYLLLEQEQERLLKQRKQLTEEQQNELRELKLAEKLFALEPKFDAGASDASLDKVAYAVSNAMVNSALDQHAEVENRAQADSQMEGDETTKSSDHLNEVIDIGVGALASSTCFGLENAIKILLHLNSKLMYPLVLRVGRICEDRIQKLRDQVVTIGVLEKEKQSLLSNKREDNMDSFKTQERLRQIDHELSRLPIKYKHRARLDHFDLNVAHMMMNAAKIEEDDQCLRQQAIKIFKINMTPETFGEVKVLTDEEEWNSKLRMELLQHVLDRIAADEENEEDESYDGADDFADHDADNFVVPDEDEDEEEDEDEYNSDSDEGGYGRRKRKAPKRRAPAKKKAKVVKRSTASTKSSLLRRGTFKERIELLLNEGMFQETIAVFPKPPKGTVDLLERLYLDIRKGDQKQLEQLLPLVEEYVTRDYLQFEFETTNSLLDLVEEHFQQFVVDMLNRISEKIIVNLVPKQYQSFVDFLKIVQSRLSKYSKDEDQTDDEEEEEEDDSKKKKRKTPAKKKAKAPKLAPWEQFYENFKSVHKGKKKLLQMVTMAFEA